MSVALMILILIMGAIIHKIYVSCVTVIHFGFRSVFTEWFWCIVVAGVIVAVLSTVVVIWNEIISRNNGGR